MNGKFSNVGRAPVTEIARAHREHMPFFQCVCVCHKIGMREYYSMCAV